MDKADFELRLEDLLGDWEDSVISTEHVLNEIWNLSTKFDINKKVDADAKQLTDLFMEDCQDPKTFFTGVPTYPESRKESNMQGFGETITNDKGGKQSDVGVRFDLIPAESLRIVASILAVGAVKYGVDNWKLIPTEDHINHAVNHLYLFLSGDKTENHLGNASCRVLFALWMSLQ